MRSAVATFVALLLAAGGNAAAGGFSLSPLGVSLSPREASSAITVENTGDSAIVVQVRTFAWSQRDGKDLREETRDLVVNPPIFRLARGEQQLVRFASRLPPSHDVERAYRAVFTEVLPRDSLTGDGLRIALSMDVPLYVQGAVAARREPLRHEVARVDGNLRVRLHNPGAAHRRLTDTEVAAGGRVVLKPGPVVVLARSSLDLVVPGPGSAALRLTATDGDEKLAIDIAPAP